MANEENKVEQTSEQCEAEPKVAELPLEYVNIKANVNGTQADVSIGQHFGNKAQKPVEAIYTFPMVDEASVVDVSMKIGDKTVLAELREREEARQTYEKARDEGQHASLVEQERPNIFTMNVAGIEPGEAIDVTTKYLAPVPWQGEGGRLSFPLVVAPRFIPGKPLQREPDGGGWSPDTDMVTDASKITPKVVDAVNYFANLELNLTPGFPAKVSSPSHPEFIPAKELAAGETYFVKVEKLRCDRDIVIVYETTAQKPEVSVVRTNFTNKDGTESFAVVELTTAKGQTPTNPIDVVFLLDRSGSMGEGGGQKIVGLRKIAKDELEKLKTFQRTVQVGIIIFDDRTDVLCELSPIGEKHLNCIDKITPRGSTFLGPAMNVALDMLRKCDRKHERCVIVVSDGQTEALDYNAKEGVRIHSVGIDAAVNTTSLKKLASDSGGQAEFVLPGEDFAGVVNRMAALVSGPVIRNVEIKGLPKDAEVVGLGDLFANRPLTVALKLGAEALAGFSIRGEGVDGGQYEWPVNIANAPVVDFGARLWAKMKMRTLQKDSEVTALSLRYGMLAKTTAFVAVMVKEKPGEKPVRVDIPVLLPHTWDYDSVFGGGGTSSLLCMRATLGIDDMSCRRFSLRGDDIKGLTGGVESFASCDSLDVLGDVEEDLALDNDPAAKIDPAGIIVLADEMLEAAKKNSTDGKCHALWLELSAAVENAAQEKFIGWLPIELAQLLLVLVKLGTYGFKLELPAEMKAEPTEPATHKLWAEAMRLLGLAK